MKPTWMSLTTEHARIIIAIVAMVTLSILLIQCKFSPQCSHVNRWTVYMLLGVIGTMVGREAVNVPRGGGE